MITRRNIGSTRPSCPAQGDSHPCKKSNATMHINCIAADESAKVCAGRCAATTRAIGYIRVSTTEQAESGISLAAQETKLRAYASALEIELVCVVQDAGISAKSLDRPGLTRALAMLSAGMADSLIVAKLDRLTRSVSDLGILVERWFQRYSLVSVADSIDTRSAAGLIKANLYMAHIQWEREAIGERTRDALAHLSAQGVAIGRAPLGSRYGEPDESGRRQLEPVSGELDTVERIVSLRDSGASYREIAAVLTSEGRATQRGGEWRASTVRGIYERRAGESRQRGSAGYDCHRMTHGEAGVISASA